MSMLTGTTLDTDYANGPILMIGIKKLSLKGLGHGPDPPSPLHPHLSSYKSFQPPHKLPRLQQLKAFFLIGTSSNTYYINPKHRPK